jgi:hypothetical protein
MEIYSITLIKRNDAVHVVSNDIYSRIQYDVWSSFLDTLRNKFHSTLNWGLYERMPVYEYHTAIDNLKYVISDFIRTELKGDVSFKEIIYTDSHINF